MGWASPRPGPPGNSCTRALALATLPPGPGVAAAASAWRVSCRLCQHRFLGGTACVRQTAAWKHTATVAPLHAQALLGWGKCNLLLPPPHLDVGRALRVTERGVGALEAILNLRVGDGAVADGDGNGGGAALAADNGPDKAAKGSRLSKHETGSALYLEAALQLAAARLRYAQEVDPKAWVVQGPATIQLMTSLLPDLEEVFGIDSAEVAMALQAVRQSYTEVGEAYFQGLGCKQSDLKAVRCACRATRAAAGNAD
jgi:hypothetical protein